VSPRECSTCLRESIVNTNQLPAGPLTRRIPSAPLFALTISRSGCCDAAHGDGPYHASTHTELIMMHTKTRRIAHVEPSFEITISSSAELPARVDTW
jgi:hypothetical protein